MKILFLITSILITTSCWAGGGSGAGNGGDSVRIRFFNIGHNIIDYYKEGFKQISDVVQEPEQLRDYLSIDIVQTSVDLLVDNRGSPVNAIGERNKIVLYVGTAYKELNWDSILRDQRLAQKLVLHEMLRAHGVNDDDYVYSNLVLKEQDIIEDQPFKLRWSLNSFNTINSTLILSFRVSNPAQELALYNRATEELKKINSLPYASLLSLKLALSKEIASDERFHDQVLPLLRRDFRETKDLLPMVDSLAYEMITTTSSNDVILKKVALLILRDFAAKYAIYTDADAQIFSDHITLIIDALNADESFRNSCLQANEELESIRSSFELKAPKREILNSTHRIISLLQQGKC